MAAVGTIRTVDEPAEVWIARNPDPASRLPFLLRIPLEGGLVFRTAGTWPRTNALYCHPVPPTDWPPEPELVERVRVRSCVRRGAAIDLILDRGRENRSQLVFTTARGRDAVFWQTARNRRRARPQVTPPTGRAQDLRTLEIAVDTREHYPYRFTRYDVLTCRRALPAGDYGLLAEDRLLCAVERKSLPDLLGSLLDGRLGFLLGDLASLPRAALVVEDRYSEIFRRRQPRPATVADRLAELQIRWPSVPIVFAETRPLAEEWTYRFLAAALRWGPAAEPPPPDAGPSPSWPDGPAPAPDEPVSTAAIRRWALEVGLPVQDRGPLPAVVREAWRIAEEATSRSGGGDTAGEAGPETRS